MTVHDNSWALKFDKFSEFQSATSAMCYFEIIILNYFERATIYFRRTNTEETHFEHYSLKKFQGFEKTLKGLLPNFSYF